MGKKSITKRWLVNNLGIILLIMLVIETIFIYAIQNSFYNSAKQYLTSRLGSVTDMLTLYAEDNSVNFSSELRDMLENFSEKDKMELMAVDSKGRIANTSSGFTPESTVFMADYEEAIKSDDDYGYYIGKQENGERILAVSRSISSLGTDYSAVRATTSLSAVDDTIATYIAVFTVVCIAIVILIAFVGFYFISSIVKPVQQISETAGKFAKGDFSIRIKNHSNDEIGELCTAINHMADELSNADAMKNEFISSVSHELRTPLTAIRGWAETISAERDAAIIRKGIKVISNETERLSQMVEELLDFSRMQSGHFSLQFDTMDILAELGEAVLIYAERARIEDVTMTYEEPEMLPFVYGDRNRLRQVFINIIDNAIKYSGKGGMVNILACEIPSGDIMVTVEDNGCGISKYDLPRIKTKFYKANHSKKGSGIGLAVADEIIAMHGGTLTLESEENKGTKVIITIPTNNDKKGKA